MANFWATVGKIWATFSASGHTEFIINVSSNNNFESISNVANVGCGIVHELRNSFTIEKGI